MPSILPITGTPSISILTFSPPKPYIRIEIFRQANDKSTETILIEETTLKEIIEWSKDIIVDVVKSNIEKSICINLSTKIVIREYNVIDCPPTNNNHYLGKKLHKGESKQFKTIGVSPKKIKNALIKGINI